MAKAQGISRMAVQRIWDRYGLKPHLTKTFKLSGDKHFVEKLYDVVGLYLTLQTRPWFLCVDEKSQIQALDRTQPGLPIKKGRCGTITHDYKRHGTTTLFAALSLLDGKVIGDCMPRHRHQEFIRFLKRSTPSAVPSRSASYCGQLRNPQTPAGQSLDGRHPRFQMYFIPSSSSWLNLVERWFREITDKRIRRGSFHNVAELIAAIEDYLKCHNQNP